MVDAELLKNDISRNIRKINGASSILTMWRFKNIYRLQDRCEPPFMFRLISIGKY